MFEEEVNQEPSAAKGSPAASWTARTPTNLTLSSRSIASARDRVALFLGGRPRLMVLGLALALALLFAAYMRLSLINPKNSDDAVVVLQAQDFLHGNVLLHGWVSSPDSFYTTFLPLYVLGGLVTTHRAVLMNVVPALTYVLIVIFCGAITWTRGTDAPHRLVITLLVSIVVGLPAFFYAVDCGPPVESAGDHKTTILLVLATFYLLSIHSRFWLAPLPLILAAVGDPMAIWIGIPAVGLVGLLFLGRGEKRLGWRLLLSAAACFLIAELLVAAVPVVGGFQTTPGYLRNTFVSLDHLPRNFGLCFECILAMFGADPFGLEVATFNTAIVLVRLVLLIFLISVIWRMLRTVMYESDTLKSLLLTAVILNLCAFVFSTTPNAIESARYLPTLTIFGPLLAGMFCYDVGIPAKSLWIATPIVAVAFLIPFGRQMLSPIPEQKGPGHSPTDPQEVIEFLEANNLTEGYGSYWSAGIFTVLSDGKVKVRQVAIGPEGKLVRFEWESARQWYEKTDARFLIFKDPSYGVNWENAARTWGLPSDTTEIDGYKIMTWSAPLHLADGAVTQH